MPLTMRYPGNRAVILDADKELATVGVRESDQGLGDITPNRSGVTRCLGSGWPLLRGLEFAEVALALQN